MTILAIDHGTTQSGYVVVKDGNPKPVESDDDTLTVWWLIRG